MRLRIFPVSLACLLVVVVVFGGEFFLKLCFWSGWFPL
jgi:hypothetical protein